MLINETEKKYRTVHILDCQVTDLRAYLVSGSINVFESLNPIGFTVKNTSFIFRYFYIWLYYNTLRKNNNHGHLLRTGPSLQSKNKNQIDIMDTLQKEKLNNFVAFLKYIIL